LFYGFVKIVKGLVMKKSILAFATVAMLAGCSYTHYSKGERYIQSGHDCIVKIDERGVVNRTNANNRARAVHPNTACAELIGKSAAKPAPKFAHAEPSATVRTVKRVYLRHNCRSYYAWCE
jgi:hypothetical protein